MENFGGQILAAGSLCVTPRRISALTNAMCGGIALREMLGQGLTLLETPMHFRFAVSLLWDLDMTLADQLAATKGVLTVQQLAEWLGLSAKTVRKWINKYGLPYTKVGSSYWLDPHSVAEWLRVHTVVRSSQKRH